MKDEWLVCLNLLPPAFIPVPYIFLPDGPSDPLRFLAGGDGPAAGLLGLLLDQRGGPVLLASARTAAYWRRATPRNASPPPCWPIPTGC